MTVISNIFFLTGEVNVFEFNPAEGVKAYSNKAETFGYSITASELIHSHSPVEHFLIVACLGPKEQNEVYCY